MPPTQEGCRTRLPLSRIFSTVTRCCQSSPKSYTYSRQSPFRRPRSRNLTRLSSCTACSPSSSLSGSRSAASEGKLVEVVILPAEGPLDHDVEIGQRDPVGNLEPSPDRRPGALQLDPEMQSQGRCAHGPCSVASECNAFQRLLPSLQTTAAWRLFEMVNRCAAAVAGRRSGAATARLIGGTGQSLPGAVQKNHGKVQNRARGTVLCCDTRWTLTLTGCARP